MVARVRCCSCTGEGGALRIPLKECTSITHIKKSIKETKIMKKGALLLAIGALLVLGAAENSHAQSFPQKVCSVVQPGNWRDTVIAGPNWNGYMCNNFRIGEGAANYQLGCITSNGYVFGRGSNQPYDWGALPNPNYCGWLP